jgi:DNA repair protein RecN (Recombination protein N)
MRPVSDQAQALLEAAGSLARSLRVYLEDIEDNPARLEEVEDRLGLIRGLQRKYGETIEAVLSCAQAASAELEAITHSGERIEQLEAEEGHWLSELARTGVELSQARRQAGTRLARAIGRELSDLRMAGAGFEVQFGWRDDPQGVPVDQRRLAFQPDGLDQVEFLVAPNPGEGLKPLVKIASGGETSRLMLGLKGVLAQADQTPTLIFDEIDQGIGGRVGAIVGQKLWSLARRHQVLCITHLPQLAAFGDEHVQVEKQVVDGRTVTVAAGLNPDGRIDELAGMLGGAGVAHREAAVELLEQARQTKAEKASEAHPPGAS